MDTVWGTLPVQNVMYFVRDSCGRKEIISLGRLSGSVG